MPLATKVALSLKTTIFYHLFLIQKVPPKGGGFNHSLGK